jgi:predicted nucleotide-binding protein
MNEIVLIVDDEDSAEVSYLNELVQTCGYNYERARVWSSALEMLRKDLGRYKAMFLDLNLGSGTQDGFILMDRMEKEGLSLPTQIVSHAADLMGVTATCSRYSFVKTVPIPKHQLFAYREYLISFLSDIPAKSLAVAKTANTVFIIHGRNHNERDRVASIVRGLGLKPVIVDVVARKGRTLIELVEEHGSESVYAIVVMTGDDIGYLKGKMANKKPRARQNVVFELGFFYGRLGRERVMCLLEPGVEKPSDIDGIVYEDLRQDDRALERRIMRELQSLGIQFAI